MKTFFRAALAAFAIGGASVPVVAQDKPATILVLDASGSMWGQIDGVNKITIARDVVSGILSDFPADQPLGFVAYGHRERGQCTDIQTIIEPAPDTAHEIIKIVNELNPRGMTPMTDAVIAAAQSLRHTEQPATVILVSDGIETCNPDPCAAARELEKAGIDFTAHVIGFDVKGEAEALMQMQCIAGETGGRFLTADNAQELTETLREVTQAAVAETATINLYALWADDYDGLDPFWQPLGHREPSLPLEGEVFWSVSDLDFNIVLEETAGNPLELDLPLGDYIITAYSEELDQFGQHEYKLAAPGEFDITVLFPGEKVALTGSLTLRAVLDSENGPEITDQVTWTITGPDGAMEVEGNPVSVDLESGVFTITGYHTVSESEITTQLTFMAQSPRTYTMVFKTPTPTATLVAPEKATAGSVIEVGWNGPAGRNDSIRIYDAGGTQFGMAQTRDGNPVTLRMPRQGGEYELRYAFGVGDKEILATQPITVTPMDWSLTASANADAGSVIEIGWNGPGGRDDSIRIFDAEGNQHGIAQTRDGNPVTLRMPRQGGEYELRYAFGVGDKEILATRPISVTPVDWSLTAPATATVGSMLEIGWNGPGGRHDSIRLYDAAGKEVARGQTRSGNPVMMRMPEMAGQYVLRYAFGIGDKEILASHAISVTTAQ